MGCFQTLGQQRLAQRIEDARSCVIYAAPGISRVVADALASCASRIGARNVVVVMDASANVARMGYGTCATFDTLTDAHIQPRQQAGLRQSLLIVDNDGWAFTMRPELLEEDAQEGEAAPNAIQLTSGQVTVLRGELPQPASVPADSDPNQKDTGLVVSIGKTRVSQQQAQETNGDLERAPPQQFDLQRQVNIYTSFIRFVELKMERAYVERLKVRLPKSLPILATRDTNLNEQINSTLAVLENIGDGDARTRCTLRTLHKLRAEVDQLRKDYFKPVGTLGRVVLRANQHTLEKRVAALEERVASTKKALQGAIEDQLKGTIQSLVPELAKALMKNPTDQFLGQCAVTKEGAEEFVAEELKRAFPSADNVVKGMKVTLAFKEVTHEMLKDKEFKDRVLTMFHRSALPHGLLDEYRGARERCSASEQADKRSDASKTGQRKSF